MEHKIPNHTLRSFDVYSNNAILINLNDDSDEGDEDPKITKIFRLNLILLIQFTFNH